MPTQEIREKYWLKPGWLLGLEFGIGGGKTHTFHWKIKGAEPSNYSDYSLGTAAASLASGTTWSEIKDSAGRAQLEPEFDDVIHHIFWGKCPSTSRIFQQYPVNKDIWSLVGTRTAGGTIGYIQENESPYRHPSIRTMLFTVNKLHPAFQAWNPTATAYTAYMNFFVMKYYVDFLAHPTVEEQKKAFTYRMGFRDIIDAPEWLLKLIR